MMEKFSIYKKCKKSNKISFIGDIFASTESDAQNAVTKTYGDNYYVWKRSFGIITKEEFWPEVEDLKIHPKDEKAKRN